VAPDVETTPYDLGAARWQRTGELLPDTVLDELRQHDAILLGAVGDPSVPQRHPRARAAAAAALRARPPRQPAPGAAVRRRDQPAGRPRPIDMLCVREGTEGPYVGNGGVLRKDTPHEIATEVSLNTAFGVERVVRYAFERAVTRPRKHLTLIHKTNVLTHAGGLWSRTVEEVAAEFPEVTVAYQHVDAASMFFITDPGRYDVIVTDNLFGDIVTDIAAAVTGGIGLAASGNLDVSGTNPSMFEPVHGSAPDIAGQGIADPTATVLSVGLLLDHLGRGRPGEEGQRRGRLRPLHPRPAGAGPHRRRRRPARRPRPVAGQTVPASAGSLGTASGSARPGCEVRVMSVAVPGTPVQTEPVPPSDQDSCRSLGPPARRGRRMAAHAAVPTHRAMLPFLRWLAFVLAGNVVAAALVTGQR
jgi:3-isopropylmalate dehydrogenase